MRRLPVAELPKHPDLHFEAKIWAEHLTAIAGLDEAGRGAWAGPVSAAAVILPPDKAAETLLHELRGVRDSKQMTARQREIWAEIIRSTASGWGVGFAAAAEIDTFGIVPATRLAMQRALDACGCKIEYLLIDALRLPEWQTPQESLIKGDARSLTIAAASVLAKTARDAVMREMDALHPGYGFGHNMGYGTAFHRAGLNEWGPCAVHRFSFAPVRDRQAALDGQAKTS